MFAKLMKHELKATAGTLGLMSLAALIAGVLGGFLLRAGMNSTVGMKGYEFLSLLSAVIMPFVFISLFAYAFGGEIYLIVRFYRHKFTDQGYLTFTLPVRSWQIYLSSLLNFILWSLVISLTFLAAIGSLLLIGVYNSIVWKTLQELPLDMAEFWEAFRVDFGSAGWVYPVISFISSSVMTITGITLGCVLAKKHKVLAAIGCYYGITMVTGMLTSCLSSVMIMILDGIQPNLVFLPGALVQMLVIVLGSWLSIWLMDKKLNLP